MKKIIVVVLAIAILLMAAACTAQQKASDSAPVAEEPAKDEAMADEPAADGAEDLVIGRVQYSLDVYQQADAAWFTQFAEEKGIQAVVLDGKASADIQQTSLDDLVSRGVDGIVVQPISAAVADYQVGMARDAGIPIVVFNQPGNTEKAPYVKLDQYDTSFEMGQIAALKWKEWYPDKPIKVGIIDITAEWVGVHINRSTAFWNGVSSIDPEAELIGMVDGGGLRDKAYAAAADLLQSNPEVNIVYGSNGDTVLGTLAAFEAAGRGKAVDGVPETELIIGTDASEEEAAKIFDPSSSLKITQGLTPKSNAKVILDTLLKVINGEITMDEGYVVSATNKVFDYWSMDKAEFEAFVADQYTK